MALPSLYRERIQFSLRSMFGLMATMPMLAYVVRRLADMSVSGLAGLAIGMIVAIVAFHLLNPEETRTLYLQILVAALVGTYAFWIPAGFPYYVLGVGLGLVVTWQGPAILTFLCAVYGITRVRVYPMPRWRPSLRNPTWPGSISDSSDVL